MSRADVAAARGRDIPEEGNWAFLEHLRRLVEAHEKSLVQCEQEFDDPTDATRWDSRTDVVQLSLGNTAHRASSEEMRVSIADVLGASASAQNPSLFRVMLCLAGMMTEMQSLTLEATETFMPALAVYDDLDGADGDDDEDERGPTTSTGPSGEPIDHRGTGGSEAGMVFAAAAAAGGHADGMGWRGTAVEGEARQKAIRQASSALTSFTRFLGTLQSLWAWSYQVQRVTRYVVQQLSALYPADPPRDTVTTGSGRSHKRVLALLSQRFLSEARLPQVWSALGDMLRAVLALDAMVAQNEAIGRGLTAVKYTLALMEADKDVLWVDDRQEPSFRELLRVVETEVISGAMLPRIVTQAFDDPHEGIVVSSSVPFQREFLGVLQQQLNALDDAFSTARETENETRYVNAVALHYLFTSLFQRRVPSSSRTGSGVTPSAPSAELDLQRRTLTKRVFDFHARIPLVHVFGPYAVFPGVWMIAHHPREGSLATLSVAQVQQASLRAAREKCQRRDAQLTPTLRRLMTLTATWVSAMKSTLPVGPLHTRAFLQDTSLLLQRGVGLARDLQHALVYLLLTHHLTDSPITLHEVDAVAQGVQLLVQIRQTYHNKTGIIAAAFTTLVKSITHIMERHLCAVASALYPVVLSQDSQRRAHGDHDRERRPSAPTMTADSLRCQYDAVMQAIHLVKSSATPTDVNLTCLSLSLDLAFNRLRLQTAQSGETLIDAKVVDEIFAAFAQLQRIAEYQRRAAHATDCGFVFWQRHSLVPLFFRRLYQQPRNAPQTSILVAALLDAQDALLAATHVRRPHVLVAKYEAFVRRCLWTEVVVPLCTDVENDLRLGTHAAVRGQPFRQLDVSPATRTAQQGPSSPKSAASTATARTAATRHGGARVLARFTRLAPFRFFSDWLHIGSAVEDYLDAQFYNLNALMPNDWETYEEMRQCAQEWYGLTLCDSRLPGTVMDQGLDVLAITENIQVFIAHYTYNLDEQLFVQRPSSTAFKHLHTLHTRHIANSIRTHGTGIMNTAVNYVYKCLVKKLTIVSQFLYDDVVRSRLLRDAKFVKKQKADGLVVYPLERAEEFVRDMKKIGLSEDGKTYLDKFRELVAEVGNALGYMRLVRSGGLRAVADAAVFLPLANDNGNGSQVRREDAAVDAAGPCSDALTLVNDVAEEMRTKLSSGSEYYRLLLHSVGAKLQQEEKYHYLRLFYLIVPPMTLSFVDFLVKEKGKLSKQKKEGVFCDDGFALGCAFLMALFDVEAAFDSLHWFATIRQHYIHKLEVIQRDMVESVERGRGQTAPPHSRHGTTTATTTLYADNEEARVHNMYLSLSMVDMFYKEYIGLEEAFLSSKILFYDPSNTSGQHATAGEQSDSESAGANVAA